MSIDRDRGEHPTDYLAELALGVLPESDAAPLRAHVASCDLCRVEYDEMSRVARLLPLAAEDIEPAPAARDQLFERIRSLPVAEAPGVESNGTVEGQPAANVVPFRPRRWQFTGTVAASAAALLIGGVAVGFVVRGGGGDGALEDRAALQAAVVESAGRGDLRVARTVSAGMSAAIVRAPGASEAFVYVTGMPPLPEGKRYQAWFTKDGKAFEPSSLFSTPTGGAWLPANGDLDGYAAMGLTIEDAGGATTPSSAPFVVVDLTKSVHLRW